MDAVATGYNRGGMTPMVFWKEVEGKNPFKELRRRENCHCLRVLEKVSGSKRPFNGPHEQQVLNTSMPTRVTG